MAPQPKFPCIRCKNNVGKEYAVKCGVCELWSHKDCEGLSDELFKFISSNGQKGVLWQCSSCQASTARLDAAVKSLRGDLTAVTTRVEKVEENSKLADSRLNKIETQMNSIQISVNKAKEEVTASIFDEIRQREERRNNLIFHNLQESARGDWEAEKKCDVDKFNAMMGELQLEINFERDALFSRRLGTRNDGRCRPLLVGMRSEASKTVILDNARRLVGTQFKDVSAVPDLTRQQREADDGLREEASRHNARLTQQDREKNLRWVVVGRKGTRKLLKKQVLEQDHSHPTQAGPSSRKCGREPVTRPQQRTQRPRITSHPQPGTSATQQMYEESETLEGSDSVS